MYRKYALITGFSVGVGLAGPAFADDIADGIAAMPGNVEDVRIGGTWEADNKSGAYRIIIARSGGEAITAFVNREPERARAVVPRDSMVDDLNRQLHRELSSYMVERPTTISRCLHLMVISKSIERIADHATNVAEEVVYLYEAKDIRHAKNEATDTGR